MRLCSVLCTIFGIYVQACILNRLLTYTMVEYLLYVEKQYSYRAVKLPEMLSEEY